MENEKINRINNFLAKNGASIDTISASRLAQLQKIDDAVQHRVAKVLEAQNILKGNPINVSAISEDTGISRKTFYNNDLLRLYVEDQAATVITDKKPQSEEIDRLKAKCDEAEEQVRKFLLRDIETENLRHENMKLQLEIQNLQKRNTSLEEQYELLQKENS